MPDPTRSDLELLRAWASGDKLAGNGLIERHNDAVHRYFINKVGDLLQQTFLACLEAWQRFRSEASFRTFLLGIARFQLYKFYDKRRNAEGSLSITALRDTSTSPTGAVARRQDEQLLLAALRHVPLETQELLELLFWEDLSAGEIAEVLDLPLNTIYSRITRAKQALREAVQQLAPDRAQRASALRLINEAALDAATRPPASEN
jgi:RNA polymerase sigma factor (sigma-70 family)